MFNGLIVFIGHVFLSSIAKNAHDVQRARKVRGALLPASMLIPNLIANISHGIEEWTTEALPCKWKGVQCDAQGNVERITWTGLRLRGNVAWEFLPRTMLHLDLGSSFSHTIGYSSIGCRNFLEGGLELSDMPTPLRYLRLRDNNFRGPLHLIHLPVYLEFLDLARNNFVGRVTLDQLPPRIHHLDLTGNELIGEVDYKKVPDSLNVILLAQNFIIPVNQREQDKVQDFDALDFLAEEGEVG